MKHITEEEFLKQVSSHEMRVIYDNGKNRHIRFRKPDTMSEHFDLITWHGHLCYAGDMGTYVFSRLNDMFEFFRASDYQREHSERAGKSLYVNLGYWAEKLQATDSNGPNSNGATEFDNETFNRKVLAYVVKWMRDHRHDTDKYQRRELWEEVVDYVINRDDDNNGNVKMTTMRDFSHCVDDELQFSFNPDWWMEAKFSRPTRRFEWACHAIAWGITQYDKWLAEPPKEPRKISAGECVGLALI